MPKSGGRNHGATLAVHQREVGFHAGQKQQKQDADLGDGIDHALERRRARKDQVPQLRHQGAKHRGTKKHAGQQLAEDGRLPDAAHALAEHPAKEQQEDQLGCKDCRRMVGCHGCPRVTAGYRGAPRSHLRNRFDGSEDRIALTAAVLSCPPSHIYGRRTSIAGTKYPPRCRTSVLSPREIWWCAVGGTGEERLRARSYL